MVGLKVICVFANIRQIYNVYRQVDTVFDTAKSNKNPLPGL